MTQKSFSLLHDTQSTCNKYQ